MQQPPPPLPPEASPTYHNHDGFYLRMAIGGGGLWQTLSSEQNGVADAKVRGGGGAIDLLIGGTPVDGLVIGGAIFTQTTNKPDLEVNGQTRSVNGNASLVLIGPFIDGFFDPHGGFHVGGALGLTGFNFKDDDDKNADNTGYGGGGAVLFGGYDAWISSDWSLGGYLKFMAASGQRNVDVAGQTYKQQASGYAFSVMFTALYH